MRLRSLRLLVATALAMLGLALDHAPPAEACGNVTHEEIDAGVKNVKIAAAALEAEDLARAKRLASAAASVLSMADEKTHGPRADLDGVYRRALRIAALATSRLGTASAQEKRHALDLFEHGLLAAPGDPEPTLLADYAEVASRVDERMPQATMMLRSLATKDLIGSAHAYAALARMEKRAGDVEAEKRARDRCRTMTKKPALCGAPAA